MDADISHKLEFLVNSIINHMLIVIAIGTVAMALVEFLKSVFMLKRLFNRLLFMKWLGVKDKEKPQSDIYKEFYSVIAGEEKSLASWFNQSTDKIFPHLHTSAQLVIEYKEIYPNLFKFLAGDALLSPADEQNVKSDASISHFVSSRIEVFRLSLDFNWERINQAMALLFAVGLTLAVGMNSENVSLNMGYLLFLGVMSGLFAPVAKDLVSALVTLQFRR